MEITEDAVRRLVDRALEIEDPTEIEMLAKQRPSALVPSHPRLIDSEFRWVADLFRAMTEETAAELVRRLDEEADGDPAGLVNMLAVGATRTAVEAFRRWSAAPPGWAGELGHPLHTAVLAGGWELGPSGDFRRLTSAVAHALTPVPGSEAGVANGRLGECGFCGFPMTRMLDVDRGVLPDLFGGEPGRILITTCTLCGSYTTIFTEDGRFAPETERPSYLPVPQPHDIEALPDGPPLEAGAVRASPFEGSAWESGGSTLGGSPHWIQDPEFPTCPRCRRTMPFVGMLTGADLWRDMGEGCFYLFHDAGCGLSAVVCQQS